MPRLTASRASRAALRRFPSDTTGRYIPGWRIPHAVDLNLVLLWGLLAGFSGVLWLLRKREGPRHSLPWSGFLIALPVAIFSAIVVLSAIVGVLGTASV